MAFHSKNCFFVLFSLQGRDLAQGLLFVFTATLTIMEQIATHIVLDGMIAVVITSVMKQQATKSALQAGGDKTALPVSKTSKLLLFFFQIKKNV